MLGGTERRGPVFFKRIRFGQDNEEFVCWKFRSMRMNVEAAGLKAGHQEPSRVTAVGRFLRNSNLDEMPQFINACSGT
ncbi:MAG: sugar transferase [Flavobacteriales bacterium]|nr:sugar transferase [Flavobacteriales bacterium]